MALQLVVTYMDGQIYYFDITNRGWKVDTVMECLVIGSKYDVQRVFTRNIRLLELSQYDDSVKAFDSPEDNDF